MIWTLVFMLSFQTPYEIVQIGYFPDYDTCARERIYQTEKGAYANKFACVQLPAHKTQVANTWSAKP